MKLNQYEWDPESDVLGNGAFAEVFRAKDSSGHFAALKIYREAIIKGSTGGSVQGKYTLEQEYKKGELLAHTNVIRYLNLDYLVHTDSMQRKASYPVLIMEYADGGSLAAWLKSTQAPSLAETLRIILEILNGLAYLHEQGIIHRDLKPGNILFKKDRMGNKVAKITDFGISRDMLEDNTNRPSATAGVGTIDYMAPEQLLKKTYGLSGEISNRTDLWALGVIFYRMLSGKMPFGQQNKDYENIHSEIISQEPDYSGVPSRYQPLIRACLQKYASDRPQDAQAVIKLLAAAEQEQQDQGDATLSDQNERTEIRPDPFKNKGAPIPAKRSLLGTYIAIAAAVILCLVLGIKFLGGRAVQVSNMQLRDSSNLAYSYTGSLRNSLPDGQGRAVYGAGTIYSGEFKNGKPEGNDTITYQNGTRYIGEVKNYVPQGSGVCYFYDKGKYDGQWKNNARNGQGTYTQPNGITYQGEWKNDLWDGKGSLVKGDGDKYTGDFKSGYMDGNGQYQINRNDEYKGDEYTGAFQNSEYSGTGTYRWHNGDVYAGGWKNSKRSGYGTMTFHDGSRYVGDWSNDKENGNGTLYDAGGRQTFTGLFLNNVRL